MRKTMLRNKRSVVWGSITLVLVLALFTMTSGTAFAQGQRRHGLRTQTVSSFQQVPSGRANGQWQPSGRADLSWNPQSQTLTVILHLSGLQPGSDHAAHIHAGTCSQEGKMLYPFKDVVVDTAGNGTTTTMIQLIGGIPATGWHITVHRGPTAQTGDLLCGNIVNPTGATSLSVSLHASS